MKQPAFWNKTDWRAQVLAPFGQIYARMTAARVARQPRHRAKVPVISIGNINVGGTGKTPATIALVEILQRLGHQAHVVTRGYGGSETGPIQVDARSHLADQVGDEPLLIAAICPVWVARDRALGVMAAELAGADVIVLDDAHQNPDVHKSLSIVMVDAGVAFGNGLVMPAGPLREPIDKGLARADVLVSVGSESEQAQFVAAHFGDIHCLHLSARILPLDTGMNWQDVRALAFAGIGLPDKFFRTLTEAGAKVVKTVPLDDHQPITESLFARMSADAKKIGAQLVTTEKDAVRLPASARGQVLAFPVRLVFDQMDTLERLLRRQLPDDQDEH